MARLKSEDKRNSILSAAIEVFAERGLAAPTAAITTVAGVAEGTLFTYFRTKDELVNALYREIKMELADAMMSGFPRKASVRHRLQHVWNRYVEWGIAHEKQHKVLRQMMVWEGLTDGSKAAGSAPFVEIDTMAQDAVAQRLVKDLPRPFIAATMSALADTAIEFARQDPKRAGVYQVSGFEMLWAGIARRT
jgi:AcrR family transcriptional regulator